MAHPDGEVMKPLVRLGTEPEDCWQWLGRIQPNGYGKKQYCGRTVLAHRWVWLQLLGPIPEGLVINHKCGNRGCVNPMHLEVVTQAANSRHGVNAKLSSHDVREIRAARKHTTPNMRKHLAERFGISEATISDIWHGRSWRKPKPFYGPRKNAKQDTDANLDAVSCSRS